MAILAHLGYQAIAVRTMPGHLSSVRETDLRRWSQIDKGLCTEDDGRRIFELFFEEQGFHVSRLLATETLDGDFSMGLSCDTGAASDSRG